MNARRITSAALAQVLQTTFDRGGSVIIPSFAVGRSQELLYFLRQIKEQGLVKDHDGFPVFMDSARCHRSDRNIFLANHNSCYDEEARTLVDAGINPLTFPDLKIVTTPEESRAINFDKGCKVIISASGMCEAGRIKHHLKHNLWQPQNTILFVGYQAFGTLGRSLVEGATTVRLFGEPVQVAAQIKQLPGISGHADVDGLTTWISHVKNVKRVFVIHGESEVADQFVDHLRNDLGLRAYAPYSGTEFDPIAEGQSREDGPPVRSSNPQHAPPWYTSGRLRRLSDRLT